jgi:hypothetical protein
VGAGRRIEMVLSGGMKGLQEKIVLEWAINWFSETS